MNISVYKDGYKLDIRFSDGMYCSEIEGKTYTSQSIEGLTNLLGHFYSIQIVDENQKPEQSIADIYIDLLKSNTQIIYKQQALKYLKTLKDKKAIETVNYILSKPVSYTAVYITKLSGKNHFSDITISEIFEYAPNISHRARLLKELSDLLQLC